MRSTLLSRLAFLLQSANRALCEWNQNSYQVEKILPELKLVRMKRKTEDKTVGSDKTLHSRLNRIQNTSWTPLNQATARLEWTILRSRKSCNRNPEHPQCSYFASARFRSLSVRFFSSPSFFVLCLFVCRLFSLRSSDFATSVPSTGFKAASFLAAKVPRWFVVQSLIFSFFSGSWL